MFLAFFSGKSNRFGIVYGKSECFKNEIECLEMMKAGGMKPSLMMYNALVNAYAQRVNTNALCTCCFFDVYKKFPGQDYFSRFGKNHGHNYLLHF